MKKRIFLIVTIVLYSCISDPIDSNNSSEDRYNYLLTKYIVGSYSDVLTSLNSMKLASEKDIGLEYLTGLCFLKTNSPVVARIYFFKVLERYPDNFEVLNNIGVSYFKEEDFRNAMKYFHLAFINNPNDDVSRENYNLAYFYSIGKTSQNLNNVTLPFVEEVVNLNSIGWFYYYSGDFPNAIHYFKKSIQIDSSYQPSFIALAYIYIESHNYRTALKYLNDAKDLDKDNPDIFNNLGIIYFQLKMYVESEESFKEAILLNPTFTEPYSNLGILLYETAKNTESRSYLLKSIELNNTNPILLSESYAYMALLDVKENKIEEAIRNKNKSINSSPEILDYKFLEEELQWSKKTIEIWSSIVKRET